MPNPALEKRNTCVPRSAVGVRSAFATLHCSPGRASGIMASELSITVDSHRAEGRLAKRRQSREHFHGRVSVLDRLC